MIEHRFIEAIRSADLTTRTGRVVGILPTFIEADGPSVSLGALCRIETRRPDVATPTATLAQVVSVGQRSIVLAPFEDSPATFSGARVTACRESGKVPVGDAFAGRAVDALAQPIDGLGPIAPDRWEALATSPTPPLARASSDAILETGVRAIDGLLTLGQGQRVGIFAASGVGKTVLMTQLANQVDADCCITCLVGERGREVETFWSKELSAGAKRRTTLISATSDESAAMRVRAAEYALTLAEYWRQRGRHVLLLLDSVTRLAMAMREIGLAAGEPPTVRAYTPSVFAAVPRLVERCGALRSGGAITAFMTVLCETDDADDPVAEMMKSLLDGHIVLSRGLAEQGHFPAIDIPRSISRLAHGLLSSRRRRQIAQAVGLISTYESARTLIETGMYAPGASAEIDRAVALRPALQDFTRQGANERAAYGDSCDQLARILGMEG